MKVVYWCMLVLFWPATTVATTLTAYSHLEEHIQVLNQTVEYQAYTGQITSFVESDSLPEHYLLGNTSARANVDGSLQVSAVGLTDNADNKETYFTSTATWSQGYFNDDASKHYLFDFDISDIDFGSDYRAGSPNRTGYDVGVFLNGTLIYDQSFVFDTTTLASEYLAAMEAGDTNPPPGETYLTLSETSGQLDLGNFAENETFTLQYQIKAFAQPIDMSSCYVNFGMTGKLITEVTPVPEPTTFLLFGMGISAFVGGRRCRGKRKK